MEQMMNAEELAKALSKTPETIRRWARAGKLPHVKIHSGDLLFSPTAIERWLSARTVPATR